MRVTLVCTGSIFSHSPDQILALVYALIVAFSRVTDNKHHPGDVAAGAIMGTFLALLSLLRVRQYQR